MSFSESQHAPTSPGDPDWPPDPAAPVGVLHVSDQYELLGLLGVGGMGVVYRARQLRPVQRIVALKLIKLGIDTPQMVARFESERQSLAQLEHPGIARVYDAGATDHGRPFFVMEFVDGKPIAEFCDEAHMTVRQRLALFQRVCDAVQHAHYKGIIHRDIKPSNILVSVIDGEPQPKVIDFGVAKATQPARGVEFQTYAGQFVGTPAYTSPEQAAGGDVDTRADVYSLGVVLYELLVGALPFELRKEVSAGGVDPSRPFPDREPRRPSAGWSSLGGEQEQVAARRASEPSQIARELRGDLDRILIKAMRTDREDRYASAAALSEDIRRYLNHEPILARPPTLAYQARKFTRRNRALVTALVAILVAIVLGASAAMIGLTRAREALSREAAALREERNARQVAQAVSDFLREMLAEVDPKRAQGRPVLVSDLLDRAAAELPVKFASQPLAAASLHSTLSETYHGLGLYARALGHARSAFDLLRSRRGEDHPETLDAMEQLGKVLRSNRLFDEAEPLLRDLVSRRIRLHGADALPTCDASEALGVLLLSMNRAGEARPLIARSAELHRHALGNENDRTLAALHNLGAAERAMGNPAAAEVLYREVWTAREKLLGPDHPWTLLTMNNLASVLLQQRRAADAEPILREILDRNERVQGPDHEATLDTLNALGTALRLLDQTPESELIFRELLTRSRRSLPEHHEQVVKSLATLGLVLEHQGKMEEALGFYREAYRLLPQSDVAPRQRAQYTRSLGLALFKTGRLEEADPVLRDAVERMKNLDLPGGREVLLALARVCEARGRMDEAQRIRAEADRAQEPGVATTKAKRGRD